MMTDEELLQKLEELTKNAQYYQLETLRSILHQNGSVRYLQSFEGVDVDIFTLWCPCPPLMTTLTSSTALPMAIATLFSLLILSSASSIASFIGHRGSAAILHRLFPPKPEVNKTLWFLYADNMITTKYGLKVMAASTFPLQGEVTIKEAVAETLGEPRPELENRIRLICEGKNWSGIVCRLWPNIHYIKCVTTGSMKQYYQKLKYYAVRVVGFYDLSPQVEYVMRAPKTPAEILTERDLISAVENFQQALRGAIRIEIVEFASFLEHESRPKQLNVFLESGLGAMYKVQRGKVQLGNSLIFILWYGAFDQLSELAIKNGASANQYSVRLVFSWGNGVGEMEKFKG
ncbi:hypothetical protein RJT34_20186 [Clitoria ternatea]|uniref:GH3 C-terminal domain-containing protein n=1 Tax=Clitoria ternatea TaxID=43366 RepID=A0AAN9ISS3_CLITE